MAFQVQALPPMASTSKGTSGMASKATTLTEVLLSRFAVRYYRRIAICVVSISTAVIATLTLRKI